MSERTPFKDFLKIFDIKNNVIFYSNFCTIDLKEDYFRKEYFKKNITDKQTSLSKLIQSSKDIFDNILRLINEIMVLTDLHDIKSKIPKIFELNQTRVISTLIYSIFNQSDVILETNIKEIINLYTTKYKNTIPISILNRLLKQFTTKLDTVDDNQKYGVRMIFAKSIMYDDCKDNDFEIIYDNFDEKNIIKHEFINFFNKNNEIFINKEKKNYIYDKLELIRNIYPKYWIDIAQKTKSNIIIFLGRKTCLVDTKPLNLFNIYLKYLGINYHNNKTVNILISCNNKDCAENLCNQTVNYPDIGIDESIPVSLLAFEDRVGLYNNYIFACRSIHLKSLPLVAQPIFNDLTNINTGHVNHMDKYPIVFNTDVDNKDSYIHIIYTYIFLVITTYFKNKQILNLSSLSDNDDLIHQHIENIYKQIVDNINAKLKLKGKSKISDELRQILDSLIAKLSQNEIEFKDKLSNYLKSGRQFAKYNKALLSDSHTHIAELKDEHAKQIGALVAKLKSESVDSDEDSKAKLAELEKKHYIDKSLADDDYKKQLAAYHIPMKEFVIKIIEFMNLINKINSHHIFFLDHNLNEIANLEPNANKYRIKFKELINQVYNSSCNLCSNIETLISNISNIKKGVQINIDDDVSTRCSVWNKLDDNTYRIIEENNKNYENNINLKILVEIMINKFKIKPKIRKEIYDTLNTLADTTNDIDIFKNNGKKIIDSLLIFLITKSPIENYIDLSFDNFERLPDTDNYYFNDISFKTEYDNLIQIIIFFQNHIKDYIKSHYSSSLMSRSVSYP